MAWFVFLFLFSPLLLGESKMVFRAILTKAFLTIEALVEVGDCFPFAAGTTDCAHLLELG